MSTPLELSRSNFNKLGKQYAKPIEVIVEKEMIENIPCYWFNRNMPDSAGKMIIYLHGGCFVLGSIQSHEALVSHLCNHLQLPVLFVEYSLAPENPFPKALEEIISVYRSIVLSEPSKDILFMGDSAGAALCCSAISLLNKEDVKKPSQLILLSPWIDLRNDSASIKENAEKDPILSEAELKKYTAMYAGIHPVSTVNPVENMYGTFPPTLILVGSGEILLDNSKLIYSKIAGNQTIIKLTIYADEDHVWLLNNITTPASQRAIKEINDFIKPTL